MLILFHKEDCPFSAKVRQFMSDHHISFVAVSCSKEAPSRKILKTLGGKEQVPFLLDTDKGKWMYESGDIIDYVKENYL